MGHNQKREWLYHFDFMMVDIMIVVLSMFFAHFIKNGRYVTLETHNYAILTAVVAILFVCIVFFLEPYSDIIKRGYLTELKRVIMLNTVLMCTLFTYLFVVQMTGDYSRIVIAAFYFISIGIMYPVHCIMKHIIRKRNIKKRSHTQMVVVTKRQYAETCVEKLTANPYARIKVKGIILLDGVKGEKEISSIPVIGGEATLLDYCKQHVVDEVLIYNDEQQYDLTESLAEMGIVVHMNVVQNVDERLRYHVGSINGILTLTTCYNYAAAWEITMKRMLDILGGLVGVFLTGLIAICIMPIMKIQSPGPIFFSQVRVGKNGRKFKIYKFRSMYMDAEERKKELMEQNKVSGGLMFKMDNDPRIFPFGHFIRKTSLDEFPQFFNVLKGDMSLVGTRPPTVDEWEQYELHHHRRLSVKPGLTGMWQVSGRSNITDFEEVVALDTKYLKEWSFGLDIKILLKTVVVVLKREGSE